MLHVPYVMLVATLAAQPAAQPIESICAERDALTTSLSREYSEAPKAVGLANNGNVVELLTSRDGRTWTLLMTRPDGTSCVVAAGEAWDQLPLVASGDPL